MFQAPATIGKCYQMCPEKEIKMREEQMLLHPLEMVDVKQYPAKADRNKMVKEFCRSSAGQPMQTPEVLRPHNILMDTITYLLYVVIDNRNFPWHIRYEFISDRLRAVRQDMIIQDIPKSQSICLLQPIVKFYAYASYRLCNEKVEKFDPHLNNKHFQECLKRLLILYDECEEITERCQKTYSGLDYTAIYKDVRPQIEAMHILLNLTNTEALQRGLSLPSKWKNTIEVQSALKMALLFHHNNYIRVFLLIQNLQPLLAIVSWLHLPMLRKRCLETMCWAYNSNNSKFPLAKLQHTLLYSNLEKLLEDLKSCNIEYDLFRADTITASREQDDKSLGGVYFRKNNFRKLVNLQVTSENYIDILLNNFSVQQLILFDVK